MKLWLLRARNHDDWDVLHHDERERILIVRADAVGEARDQAAGGAIYHSPWRDRHLSSCRLLPGDGDPGVVLELKSGSIVDDDC